MRPWFALVVGLILVVAPQSQVVATEPDVSADPFAPELHMSAEQHQPGSKRFVSIMAPSHHAVPEEEYIWVGDMGCRAQVNAARRCLRTGPTDPADPDDPELTLGQILTAVRELTLPSLKINIQPGGETLINFDTIFYAQPQPFQRSITLLDYDIDIKATPSGYTWHHGDGTSHTTRTPGAAYPSKAVTHRYKKKAKDLRPSVDVTYTVTFRVDGGPWQDLGQTLTANGPAGTLDVLEATAVLTRY